MSRTAHVAALVVVLLCVSSTRAAAIDPPVKPRPSVSQACDGHGRSGWMLRDTLVALSNPLGGEVQSLIGYCTPLVEDEGILWTLTELEAGVHHNLSPSYTQQGVYLHATPLSFLVLKARASFSYYWPLPGFKTAAYISRTGYDDSWPSDGISSVVETDKEDGLGLNLYLGATLRASFPIAQTGEGPVEVLILDAFGWELWSFGPNAYYYNQRLDAILRGTDRALTNTAALLVSIPLAHDVALRAGATDSLTYVVGGDHVALNQVGALAMLVLRDVHEAVAELAPLLRITGYTEHKTRQLSLGLNVLIGVDVSIRL